MKYLKYLLSCNYFKIVINIYKDWNYDIIMIELDLKEVKENAKYFQEYKTYVFVQTLEGIFYNGYIIQVTSDSFMFLDDEIDAPFPIRFNSLKAPIVPSKKKGEDFNFGRKNGN